VRPLNDSVPTADDEVPAVVARYFVDRGARAIDGPHSVPDKLARVEFVFRHHPTSSKATRKKAPPASLIGAVFQTRASIGAQRAVEAGNEGQAAQQLGRWFRRAVLILALLAAATGDMVSKPGSSSG
jgi:hypothetical protein